MKCTFLEADIPLVKHYTPQGKTPYPFVKNFTSHEVDVTTLSDFEVALNYHAARGNCLLKGNLDRALSNESRAGHTDSYEETEWICLDIDGMKSVSSPDELMTRLGMPDVSYILQWSASMGMYGNMALRCHLFVLLDRPTKPAILKEWLKYANLEYFSSDLSLSASGVSLKWGLDISTCQNDKLLYISPPTMSDPSLCQFSGQRISVKNKTYPKANLNHTLSQIMPGKVQSDQNEKINEMRKAAGMKPKRENGLKMTSAGGHTVLSSPDTASVTSTKIERGFVYLNLNGGDSFAYYHPEDNFEYIHNFKGEPSYLTKTLVPDYYAEQVRAARKALLNNKVILAFRDRITSKYWNGTYDPTTNEIELHPAKSEKQLDHWVMNYQLPPLEAVPVWRREFDPTTTQIIDVQKQWVNLFKPTKYMLAQGNKVIAQASTPTIDAVINNAVGRNNYDRFINWLAYIFQKRQRPLTAWVLHGVEGTGKGVLYHKILKPLFGPEQCQQIRMTQLKEQYNPFMQNTLLIAVDEAQISETKQTGEIMASLKNFITEPTIQIRDMYAAPYTVPNYAGWLFFSNMPDPVVINQTDRRFNVGDYARVPLLQILSEKQIMTNIEPELEIFAHKLHCHQVNEQDVIQAKMTESKAKVQKASMQSVDVLANALLAGDIEYLVDQLPSADSTAFPTEDAMSYTALIKRILETQTTKLHRDDVQVIFRYCIGNRVPNSPTKFSQYLGHHNIDIKAININGKSVRGWYGPAWDKDQQWFKDRCDELDVKYNDAAPVQPINQEEDNSAAQ